jgi:tRNA modification GTPase
MEELWSALEERVRARLAGGAGAPLSRERHRAGLEAAQASLARVLGSPDRGAELVAEDLRAAVQAMGRITGRVAVDDVLEVVFREFCIGK